VGAGVVGAGVLAAGVVAGGVVATGGGVGGFVSGTACTGTPSRCRFGQQLPKSALCFMSEASRVRQQQVFTTQGT
jgi:hypothetical protein